MTWGHEKDISKRGRLIMMVVAWAVGIPLFIGLWQLSWWVALIGIVASAWGTWDYIKKGGLFEQVDQGFKTQSRVARRWDAD